MLTAEDEKYIGKFKGGPFKRHFVEFIEFRRGKGEKIQEGMIRYMKEINDILCQNGTEVITKEMVDDVFSKKMDSDGLVHHNLLSTMRAFTIYMSAIVSGTFIVPVKYWNTRRIGNRCYTFSEDEVSRIISTVDSFCRGNTILQKRYCGTPPYPVIVRVLVGTGMRLGEVLGLTTDDVDIENGIISIRDGKGHVSRHIPVSSSLKAVLRSYYEKRKAEIDEHGYYFLSARSKSTFSRFVIDRFFRECFKEAGIKAKNGERPVVHTFRHTFCTMALDRLIDEGVKPDAAVPLLAAYVGHNNLRVTYRYLHMSEDRIEGIYQDGEPSEDLIPAEMEDSYEW